VRCKADGQTAYLPCEAKKPQKNKEKKYKQLERGPMPNVMAALPNIGGALCSTPQSSADARYWSAVQ